MVGVCIFIVEKRMRREDGMEVKGEEFVLDWEF